MNNTTKQGQNKMKFTELKKGDKVSYTKEYKFGKTAKIKATVVMIKGQTALLDSGDNIGKWVEVA